MTVQRELSVMRFQDLAIFRATERMVRATFDATSGWVMTADPLRAASLRQRSVEATTSLARAFRESDLLSALAHLREMAIELRHLREELYAALRDDLLAMDSHDLLASLVSDVARALSDLELGGRGRVRQESEFGQRAA